LIEPDSPQPATRRGRIETENEEKPTTAPPAPIAERLAYSVQEAADMLGINYYTMYRLIQRQKLKTCRVLRGKLLVPRTELLQLLQTELR
jgi:excisionase family DNA binding protein